MMAAYITLYITLGLLVAWLFKRFIPLSKDDKIIALPLVVMVWPLLAAVAIVGLFSWILLLGVALATAATDQINDYLYQKVR